MTSTPLTTTAASHVRIPRAPCGPCLLVKYRCFSAACLWSARCGNPAQSARHVLKARNAPKAGELGSVIVVAIDIGGTFTDLIGFDQASGQFVQAKSLPPPAQLGQGVIDCIRKSGLAATAIDELIHGSTIAINTLIQRKGAKTGLIVTRGTRDVYIIGRGNRPEAYHLLFHRHRPRVPRRLTREVEERRLSSAEVHVPLARCGIADACRVLAAEGVEA